MEEQMLDEISTKLEKIDLMGEKIDKIVTSIVAKYCSELDDFVNKAYKLLSNKEVDVPDVDIEYMTLQLPCLMYFASNSLEDLGIREDIARRVEKEIYNNTILSVEGRVSEKESAAQIAIQKDALVTSINSRAYRKVKSRVELALEMLGSLKKVLANRISNRELSNRDK